MSLHSWVEIDRLPSATPAVHFQPPTPVTATGEYPASAYMTPSSSVSSLASSRPISISGSRPSSRAGGATTSLSRSSSFRHQPYDKSYGSFSERPFRPRSATSASDRSDWDTDSIYSSSVDSFAQFTPSSSYELPAPPQSPYVATDTRGGRANKSHARKKQEGHVKRPPNAFILFRSHCCSPDAKVDASIPEPPGTAHARHLASLDINNSQHISVIVSQVWKGLSKEDKAYWADKAQQAKEEHARLHPGYRYQPQQRKKEEVRRRKRTDAKVKKEQTDACLEVARQVLEIERNRSGQPLREEFTDDLQGATTEDQTSQSSAVHEIVEVPKVAPTPKKKRVRKPAATKGKSARTYVSAASPEGVFNVDLSPEFDLATPTLAAPDAFQRPHTAPYLMSNEMGDFSSASTASFFGRRTSHTRTTQGYTSQDAVEQFGFMAQLHSGLWAGQPQAATATLDPQFAALDLSRPGTAASYSTPTTGIDPTLAFYPSSSDSVAPDTFVLPVPPTARPPPPSATSQQLSSYTFGGPSTSPVSSPPPAAVAAQHHSINYSPIGATFAFGVEGPGQSGLSAPLADRRTAPQPLPLDALKQRRNTLRPGNVPSGTSDIMLISPMITTFNGRKQSTGTWSAGLRRLSLTPTEAAAVQSSPRPGQYARSSLSAGVWSANGAFETITVSPSLLESLPTEDPLVTAEFFAQFTAEEPTLPLGLLPQDEYAEEERPSTACSDWSTDGEVERLDMALPEGFMYDRRRSTLVPSKFASSVFSTAPTSAAPSPGLSPVPFSAPANNAGFHLGSNDFFLPPKPALATAGPGTSAFETPPVPVFGSSNFGRSFQPFAHRPSVDAILAAASSAELYPSAPPAGQPPVSQHPSPDVPVSVTGAEEDWAGGPSSMTQTALSILQARRQQQAFEEQPSLPVEQGQSAQPECEYVYLTMDQLQDQHLIGQIHQHGYGIAFDAAACPPSASSPSALPSGETLPLGGSPLGVHSATF
ncbi:hypothetical protein JCM11251_003995 [Rhodosporidiobolus azoricus]